MRKIEAQMNAAIAGRRNWSKDNTRVEVDKHGDTYVYLHGHNIARICLLYTSPSPRDNRTSRMPSSA